VSYEAVANESWENADRCDAHGICEMCMLRYVEVKILEEGLWNIRCPGEGCRYRLVDNDVRNILASSGRQGEALEKYARLRNENFAPRLQEILAAQSTWAKDRDDVDSSEALLLMECQVCPCCSVLVRREGGCTHIACRCGTDFCFGCGAPMQDTDECICDQRDDIYNEEEDDMGGEGRPALGFWRQHVQERSAGEVPTEQRAEAKPEEVIAAAGLPAKAPELKRAHSWPESCARMPAATEGCGITQPQ